MSFEEAVKSGRKNIQELQMGRYYVINVGELQRQGISTPESPKLPADILKQWGYKGPTESVVQPTTQPIPQQPIPQQPTPQQPAGNISGTYQGTYKNNVTGAVGNMNVRIVQTGNNIQGEIEIVNEGNGAITGTITGTSIQFTGKINAYYGTFTVVFTGIVQGNTISGNYSVAESGINGTFILKR